MNHPVFGSSQQCSSGSIESGWTLYLEHSQYPSHRGHEEEEAAEYVDDVEDEEEDMSMVSDASSGPPIFHEDGYYINAENGFSFDSPIDERTTLAKNRGSREKVKENSRRKKVVEQQHPSFLDDTASSTFFSSFPQSNLSPTIATIEQAPIGGMMDFPQGFPETHYEGRSALHEPFGFFQTSLSGNQLQHNQWFGGNMGMR